MCQLMSFFRVAFSNTRDCSVLVGGCFNRSSCCSTIPHKGQGDVLAQTTTTQHTKAQTGSKELLPQTCFLGWSYIKMKANKLQEQWSFLSSYLMLLSSPQKSLCCMLHPRGTSHRLQDTNCCDNNCCTYRRQHWRHSPLINRVECY